MIDKDRIIKEFIELVSIASPSRKEKSFCEYLQKVLREMGLEVTIDEKSGEMAGSNTGNLFARLKGNRENVPALLFAAHMDTVEPAENIEPVIENGSIKSRGKTILGADDKSGIAAVLEAIRHIKEEKIPHGDVEVLFTVGEEIGLLGSSCLDYGLITAKTGFVLDSTGDPGTIVNQGPAQDKIQALIYGKSAHAGIKPEEGINAIQVAARAIDRMKLLRIDAETTANIGIIKGGTATNIICDKVVLEGEARSLHDNKLEQQTQHMLEELSKAGDEFGAKVEIEQERVYSAFYIPTKQRTVQLAVKAVEALGLKLVIGASGGGSDTNNFNARGIEAVNLGTGMNKVHTTEEFILTEHLFQTAQLVARIIENNAVQ